MGHDLSSALSIVRVMSQEQNEATTVGRTDETERYRGARLHFEQNVVSKWWCVQRRCDEHIRSLIRSLRDVV